MVHRLRRQRAVLRGFIAAVLALLVGAAGAWANSVDKAVEFDIRAQKLATALLEFSKQAGVQVLTATEIVMDLEAPAVHGRMAPAAAMTKLLEGTALRFHAVGENAIAIEAPQETRQSALDSDSQVKFAQGAASTGASASASEVSAGEEKLEEITVDIPEILVTGSRVLNRDIRRTRDDIQPYVVFDRKTIEQAGAANIDAFLKQRLTMGTQSATNNQVGSASGPVTGLRLRGLTLEETLILVDGRRIAGRASNGAMRQPDINGIPLAAVERIEVLPTTASGIYGGSATGGVINIVMRRDYSGLQTQLTYGNAFDGAAGEGRVDVSGGFNLEGGRTNVMIAGAYADTSTLDYADRDFVQRARDRIAANNPGYFSNPLVFFSPPLGVTTNIRSTNGQPLSLKAAFGGAVLPSTFTSVPLGYAGPASDNGAGLVNNAGVYNLDLAETAQNNNGGGGRRQSLLNGPTIESLTVAVHREFTPRLRAFLEFAGANNSGAFNSSSVTGSFSLLATSPANPFDQPIAVTTPAFGTDGVVETTNQSRRFTGGVSVALPWDWSSNLEYTWSRMRTWSSSPGAFFSPIALSAVRDGTVEVFRDTDATTADFLPFLLPSTINGPAHTTLRDVALNIGGPIARLPAGPLALTARIESSREFFDDFVIQGWDPFTGVPSTDTAPNRKRNSDSIYLESRVPIVSAANSLPGLRLLELQLAIRQEEGSISGADIVSSLFPGPQGRVEREYSSTDPQIGLKFQPLEALTFRASWGTGFLPPRAEQLVSIDIPQEFTPIDLMDFGLSDPRRNDELVGSALAADDIFTFAFLGGTNLKPEESESRSAGVILTPPFVPGLRLSLDWTKIEKTDVARFFTLDQAAIDNEASLPGVIVRGPAGPGETVGPIIGINGGFRNISRQDIEAYDLALDYQWRSSRFGEFDFHTGVTRNMHNQSQVLPTSPVLEGVGFVSILKWAQVATLAWNRGPWSASWTARYYDSYRLGTAGNTSTGLQQAVLNQGSQDVPTQTYHDLFAGYRFEEAADWLAGTDIELMVKNVFDTKPAVDMFQTSNAFYSSWGDPRLASYQLVLRKNFGGTR